ncbi:B12-binding domain-containing radical SAM protein [candidate division KSB1 bacterium]|nr:B12-binding domain-containing radical SAM protein [candidate division KSB1 bacterium]
MAKLALVNHWSPGIGNNKLPLGLGYLAAYLKTYLDFDDIAIINTGADTFQKIAAVQPEIVGFTVYTAGYYDVLQLMQRVKQELGVITLLGGPHITCLPQQLPAAADIGVIGEGEATLLELMRLWLDQHAFSADKLRDIPGIVFRVGQHLHQTPPRPPIVPLDRIPMPDRELLRIQDFLKPSQILMNNEYLRGATMLSSRGCPYHCIYCHVQSKWGRPRLHSAERVVAEIELLVTQYQVAGIYIEDDLFISSLKRIEEITQGLATRHLLGRVKFFVDLRANLVRERLVQALKAMGVVKVALGLESGSERILSYLKGGDVTVADNRQAVRLLNQHGLGCHCCFMIGAPPETREDIRQTQALIREILDNHPRNYCQVTVVTPLPGTQLWDYAIEKGHLSATPDWRQFSLSPGLSLNPDFYVNEQIPFDEFLKISAETVRIANSRRLKSIFNRFSTHYLRRIFEDPALAWRILKDYVWHR